MLEREMEDLIAENPEYFFPRFGFVLRGRQQSFQGVGRFDLLFTDRNEMHVLMELKAIPAKYEVIDQLGRYRDALAERGIRNVIMWIVAPVIPRGLQEFLAHLGIEFTEIREAEFRNFAETIGYSLRENKAGCSDKPLDPPVLYPHELVAHVLGNRRKVQLTSFEGRVSATSSGSDEWGFGEATQPSFLLRQLELGTKTKEELRSEFINFFYPGIDYAEARRKSGFSVFFSDAKRPVGTYHASRAIQFIEDSEGRLSLGTQMAVRVKEAIRAGILGELRGVDARKQKAIFDAIQRKYGLPTEE